jgi:hypothetical protein
MVCCRDDPWRMVIDVVVPHVRYCHSVVGECGVLLLCDDIDVLLYCDGKGQS